SSRLSANMHHRPRRGHKIRLADVVALFFSFDDRADEFFQIFIGCATPHELVQVVVPNREEASSDFAIGSDANAAAMPTKRMRHRRNDSNFSDAIVEFESARRLTLRMRDFDQRTILGHALKNFLERNDGFRGPNSVFFEWHEFDKAHNYA